MREILFRGKSFNGEWEYGVLVFSGLNNELAFMKQMHSYDHQVIPETVGQYTGLNDKNGTKIFEGDILQFDYIGKNLGVNGVSYVSFQNGKFGVEWGYHKEFVCLDGFANTALEVIGNIVDNPELLDGK